ncbi:hypothetical protein Bca4012_058321 [Brassica carinata]
MEDEPSEVLNKMALFSKRGYSFTTDDRKNRSINLHDVNEEIGRRSLLFGNVEMGQTSSNEEFVLSKINSINKMMEDEFRSMNCRLSLVEKENKELKDRVSKLENRHGVTSDENLHNESNKEPVINTEPMVGTGSKSNEADQANDHFINEDDPNIWTDIPPPNLTKRTEESIVQTTFEADEVVEIASCRKWTKRTRQKEFRKRIHVRIRPLPPTGEPEEMKSLELMDSVEAYHNESWCSGRVRAIHSDDIYSVSLDRSTNFLQFSLSDLCIPKTWINGDWKTTKEIEKQQAQSVKPSTQSEKPSTQSVKPSTQSEKPSQTKGKTIVGKKRKATGPPVDHLPFLQPEEKRPIGPRNPPMPVTPEHIDAAFAMLNRKRIEQSTWFREKSLPKACFVPVHFLETVGGLETPNKIWMEDVDVVYGVVHERLKGHYIGVEIHLLDNTITLFHCGLQKRGTRIENIPLVKKLAVLIPAIKLEIMNEEVNFKDIVPFQVKKAEKLPKTRFPCGIFVLKMLECKSFGLKKMLDINDDTTIDLRSKLSLDMLLNFAVTWTSNKFVKEE